MVERTASVISIPIPYSLIYTLVFIALKIVKILYIVLGKKDDGIRKISLHTPLKSYGDLERALAWNFE